jgi:DNA-binding transcriptional ArsR family regulator
MTSPVNGVFELEASMCRALGDATRLRIVYALADGPLSVGRLSRLLQASQPTVSRHLKVLREQSLVSASRHGQLVEYELRDSQVLGALDALRQVLAQVLLQEAAICEGIRGHPMAETPAVP